MTSEKEEKAFLEEQLQWIKQREALFEQIENKLHKMKYIAEQIAKQDKLILESEKRQLNEQFLQLKVEIAELENQLRIFYN